MTEKKGLNPVFAVVIVAALVVLAFWGRFSKHIQSPLPAAVNSFLECQNAGYPIMESYPEQCKTPDGRTFVNDSQVPVVPPSGTTGWTDDRIAAGYIAGKVMIGPNCPVEQIGYPCLPPPEAYTSRKVVVDYLDSSTTKEANLNPDGTYKIAVGPGDYLVQIVPAGIGPGEKKPATVKSFETTEVDFNIDTGIR